MTNQSQKALDAIKDFERLNKKESIPINQLAEGEKHPFVRAVRVQTKFGKRILLELIKGVIFLPAMFNDMKEETLELLNDLNFSLIRRGSKQNYILHIVEGIPNSQPLFIDFNVNDHLFNENLFYAPPNIRSNDIGEDYDIDEVINIKKRKIF